MCKVVFLSILLSLVSSVVCAKENIDAVVQRAVSQKLFEDPYWRLLLHYQSKGSGWESEIVSPEFFLSKKGNIKPKDELIATIRAIYEPISGDQNSHAQCRFVARFKWLEKELGWRETVPTAVNCNLFEEYSFSGKVNSLSMIFATGFLGNPASYYGHVLLKFNRDDYGASKLLDNAINYGAKVPSDENALVYIVKGVFGGYEASFSHEKFYRNNHVYVENELRDMWEYQLNLSKEEVDKVVAHSWELLGKRYLYFFAKENCAYRMGELIELVTEQPMFSRKFPWTLPAEIFERLNKAVHRGDPLVKTITRIPSRQGMFYTKYESLNDSLQKEAKDLAHTHDFTAAAYKKLSDKEKAEVIDTLFDYYEFLMVADKDNQELKVLKRELLQERFKINYTGGVSVVDQGKNKPPHKGPLASMMQYNLHSNSLYDIGVGFRFRPTYYDAISIDEGRIPNSTLTMMDIQVVYMEDQIYIKRFDFMSVESLSVSPTSMRDDSDWAWKMRFSIENANVACIDCNVANAVGGFGKAIGWFSTRTVLYAMLEMNLQSKFQQLGTVGTAAYIGVVGYPMDMWKSKLLVGKKKYLDGDESDVDIVTWENRFGKNRDWDIRINYELNVAKEVTLGLGLYW